MDSNTPSTTARISAFGRAYHATHANTKIFDDSLADQFFTDDERALLNENLSRAFAFFDPEGAAQVTTQAEALAGFMRSQSLPITLSRAVHVEEILESEIQRGVSQYVILGAGLDTFAFRRPELVSHLDVFEVDHPGTQNYKRQRITDLGWQVPAQLHWVPLDFAQGDLIAALHSAQYDPTKLTLFSWLGVSYYLTRETFDATTRAIASIAPTGSTLLFDYLDADAFIPERTATRVAKMQYAARMSGEPMLTGFDPAALATDLNALGFRLQENLSPADIEQKYFQSRTDNYHAFEHIHFAHAIVI